MMRSKPEKTSAVGYLAMMLFVHVRGFIAYLKEPWAFTGVTLFFDLRSNLLSSSATCVYLAESEHDGLLHGTLGGAKKGYKEVGLIALGVFFFSSHTLMHGCYRKPGQAHSRDATFESCHNFVETSLLSMLFFCGDRRAASQERWREYKIHR